MKLNETLLNTFKRTAVLRQVAAIMRKQSKRQALGYGAKLRMRRMEFIRSSQEQGIAVAKARREAQKNGTMLDHLKQYYPMHPHVHRA